MRRSVKCLKGILFGAPIYSKPSELSGHSRAQFFIDSIISNISNLTISIRTVKVDFLVDNMSVE